MHRRGKSETQGIAVVAAGALILIVGAVIVVVLVARSSAGPSAATPGAKTAAGEEAAGATKDASATPTEPQPERTPTASSPEPGGEGGSFAPIGAGAGGLTPVSPSALGDGGAPVGFALKKKAQSVAGSASEGSQGAERNGDR